MKYTFTIRGEYGIQQGDEIVKDIQADTKRSAISKFIKEVKEGVPFLWERMGKHNIYIIDKVLNK